MIISDLGRMNGGKLRLKLANKSNIQKIPSCLCRFLLTPDTIYYSSDTLVSIELRHLSAITCGHLFCSRHVLNTKMQLSSHHTACEVIHPQRNKGTKYPGVHICSSPIVYCVAFFFSCCRQQLFFKATKLLMPPWRLNSWCPVSLLFHYGVVSGSFLVADMSLGWPQGWWRAHCLGRCRSTETKNLFLMRKASCL